MLASRQRIAEPAAWACAALLAGMAGLWPLAALAALPSAPQASTEGAPDEARAAPAADSSIFWGLAPLRLGGSLAYDLRRDNADGLNTMQTGLLTTVNASTNGFIWQPWFATLNGSVGFTKVSSTSSGDFSANNSNSDSVLLSGNGQLNVLAQSRFPFEAHIARDNNSINSNLALPSDATSERYGFSQRYYPQQGEASVGWDRSSQQSSTFGLDQQDTLQLRLAQSLQSQQIQLSGTRTQRTHEQTGESADQDDVLAQHNYTPTSNLTVLSMLNLSQSSLQLQQGESTTHLAQASSNAFWRLPEHSLTVNSGVRAIMLTAESEGLLATGGSGNSSRLLNSNANAGLNYDYSRSTHFNAAFNVSQVQNSSAFNNTELSTTSISESLGASYQPDAVPVGQASYSWATSATAFNRSGGEDAQTGVTGQLNHSLSQSFRLDAQTSASAGVSQSVSVTSSTAPLASSAGLPPPAQKQLTHSAYVSWDRFQDAASALVRLSASDNRALDGDQAYFQLINLQASSNLPQSGYASWTGSLTLQAVRQGHGALTASTTEDGSISTSALGGLSYQNQRFLGERNLRFGSDLRLNLQWQQSQRVQPAQSSFLSQLESRNQQETMAWLNHIDYSIGRTQLRFSVIVSRTSAQRNQGSSTLGQSSEEKTNSALHFTLIRRFGQY